MLYAVTLFCPTYSAKKRFVRVTLLSVGNKYYVSNFYRASRVRKQILRIRSRVKANVTNHLR